MKRLKVILPAVGASMFLFASHVIAQDGFDQAVRSGPKPSGAAQSWSQWYVLCSGPVPTGYRIVSNNFHLEGDRGCTAWANCEKTDERWDQVCWRFQMQGHEEGGDPVRNSEGVLTYRLEPLQ